MQARCTVSLLDPLSGALQPDQPLYEACDLTIDYTDALLSDLGPQLLMLYASYAGPPVTRDALAELAEPVVHVHLERATREELLQRVRDEYPTVLARARERIAALR